MERTHGAGVSVSGAVWPDADAGDPAATSHAAELLDEKGELGVLAAGAYADIVAVSGDPLQDVKELENVRFVMKNGTVFKNEPPK